MTNRLTRYSSNRTTFAWRHILPAAAEWTDDPIPEFDSPESLLADNKPDLLFVASLNYMHLEHIHIGLEADVRIFSKAPSSSLKAAPA